MHLGASSQVQLALQTREVPVPHAEDQVPMSENPIIPLADQLVFHTMEIPTTTE